MPLRLAFLRAINVGGRTVRMERLRELVAALGHANVETFIASGNVIFQARDPDGRALEQQIERQLREALGYEVATFVRSASELAAIAAHQPFGLPDPAASGHTLSVVFLKGAPDDAARERVLALRTATDELRVHGREAYWLRRTREGDSAITGARLERALGGPATVRNVTTVRRLAARYAPPA